MRSLLFAALMWAGAADTSLAQKKREQPPPAPPPVAPLAVKVARGATVEIPLRIYGTRAQTLTFLIRAEPEHGKLSQVRRAGQEAAVVTYAPPDDLAITRDRFSYAVKSSEGVSAAADVVITITDEAARLLVPDEIEFPAVLAGGAAEGVLRFTNTGGLPLEGKVEIAAPWRLEGSNEYQLAGGESAQMKLIFAPEAPGEFRREVRYSSQINRTTVLRGMARAPLAVSPAQLQLRARPHEISRGAIVEVTNHTSEPLLVTLTGSERLIFTPELKLQSGEAFKLPVEMRSGDAAAIDETIQITAGEHSAAVRVVAQPLGPMVRAEPHQLSFGKVVHGKSAQRPLRLVNAGGVEANVQLDAQPPFATDQTELKLPPGAAKVVGVTFSAMSRGSALSMLQIRSEGSSIEIPLQAEVPAAIRPVRNANSSGSNSAPRSRQLRTEPSKAPPTAGYEPHGVFFGEGFSMFTARIERLKPRTCSFVWAAKHPEGAYRAETRRLSLDEEGKLQSEWNPYPNFRTEVDNGQVIGTLEQLDPRATYSIRVRPVEAGGELGAPLFHLTFNTPPRFSPLPKITPMRVLVVLFLACLAALAWQRWRAPRIPGL